MSTRSLTVIKDRGIEIVCMYRHCDSYPSGHGKELAEFLKGASTGVYHLAAQMVSHFKQSVRDIHLRAPGTCDCGERYLYEVLCNDETIVVRVSSGEELFSGTVEELEKWCEEN